MLGRCGSMLGPCWVIWWAFGVPWRFLEGKNNPQQKVCPLRVFFGDFWGLCRANVGPFWVYVGPMLGHWMGFWGSMEVSGGKKYNHQQKVCPLRVFFGWLLKTMSGQCWAVLGLCWAHVGSLDGLLGFHGGFWREKNNSQHQSLSVEGYFG